MALEAIKILAKLRGEPTKVESHLMAFETLLEDETAKANATLQTIAAGAYLSAGDHRKALKLLQHRRTVEQMAMATQCYLKMNRIDLATKSLAEMQKFDDDHSLTQLCRAWVNLSMGGAKYQEASYIFDVLIQKFGETPALLNGHAVTCMHLGRFAEAEQKLADAAAKDPENAETLINSIVCARCLNKSDNDEKISTLTAKLKRAHPHHPWVLGLDGADRAFDEAASKQ